MKSEQARRAKHMIIALGIRTLIFILGILPRRSGMAIGRKIGSIAWKHSRRSRRIALENLELIFGEEKSRMQIEQMAENVWIHMGEILIEAIYLLKTRPEKFESLVRVEGYEHVQQALKKGKGVIILAAHFGNWEFVSALLAFRGNRVSLITRRFNPPLLDRIIAGGREKIGYKSIIRGSNIRRVYRELAENGIVLVYNDLDTWSDGVIAPFIGRPSWTAQGCAAIAMRTRTPVIPGFCFKDKKGKWVIRFQSPVPVSVNSTDLTANVSAMNNRLSRMIMDYPEQWAWFHDRWKTMRENRPAT